MNRAFVLLLGAITLLLVTGCGSRATLDTTRNSSNIGQFLDRDEDYPYVGFWKENPSDGFGLAINKAGNGLYSVSFCGPGGTFEPGTYRPNTKLVDDPLYKVIDEDTIEVKGDDGFSKYVRFE